MYIIRHILPLSGNVSFFVTSIFLAYFNSSTFGNKVFLSFFLSFFLSLLIWGGGWEVRSVLDVLVCK